MRILRIEPNSPEWDGVRKGRITASMMDNVFAKPGSAKHDKYLSALAHDLAGIEAFDDPRNEPWFEHGREYEQDAIFAYELRHQVDTWRDAVLVHENLPWLSATPDFLIGPDGDPYAGGEVKCRRTAKTYFEAIHGGTEKYQRLSRQYYLQVQTAMAISGFDEWIFVNYWPGGDKAAPRESDRLIYRDDEMIREILDKAANFYADALVMSENL